VLEVIRAFDGGQRRERPIAHRFAPRRPGDIAQCFADPAWFSMAKAMCRLGWQAEKGLAEMCADAWRWQQKNPEGFV
jgi:UDP-glucose 4-epimerase